MFEIDPVSWFEPNYNNFCQMFPWPVSNNEGYKLYFLPVAAQNATIGFGVKKYTTATNMGQLADVYKVIAFPNMESLNVFFPDAESHIVLSDYDQGTPMRCGEAIQGMPNSVPPQLIQAALANPNVIQAGAIVNVSTGGTMPQNPVVVDYRDSDTNLNIVDDGEIGSPSPGKKISPVLIGNGIVFAVRAVNFPRVQIRN